MTTSSTRSTITEHAPTTDPSISAIAAGRLMVVAAMAMQAIGKVAFGTWLFDLPSTSFVFLSFGLTAALFLLIFPIGRGEPALGLLALLNVFTAVTFLCFFFALKHVEPAIVGALEIGIGPIAALLLTAVHTGHRPDGRRIGIGLGVMVGCAALAHAALDGSGLLVSRGQYPMLGLIASVTAGVGATLITILSKSLANRGWSSGAILAHRFYLIVPLALGLAVFQTDGVIVPSTMTSFDDGIMIVLVALIGVTLPLYLLQLGIKRCEPYTVMVCLAALPVMTFLLQGLSPAYAWSWPTLIGISIIALAVIIDSRQG
ncbi:MAG: hypothetical protein ACR2RF_20800 [Geminicoccaceae bacterium]